MKAITIVAAAFATLAVGAPVANQEHTTTDAAWKHTAGARDHSTTDGAWKDHKRNVDVQEGADDHSNTDDANYWGPPVEWIRKRNVDVQDGVEDHSSTDDANLWSGIMDWLGKRNEEHNGANASTDAPPKPIQLLVLN